MKPHEKEFKLDKEDLDMLNELSSKRMQMIDELYKDGVPKNKDEIILANTLITSATKDVIEKARLKQQDEQANNNNAAMAIEIIKALAEKPQVTINVNRDTRLTNEAQVTDAELTEYEDLNLSDFVPKDEEDD